MTYPLQLLQHTAHYVISKCTYEEDGSRLNHTSQKWAYTYLVQALNELKKRQTQAMVISPENGALSAFFEELNNMKIAFPENSTFIIKLKGTHSYEKVVISKLSQDDQIALLAEHIVEQCKTSKGNGLSLAQAEMAQELLEENMQTLCLAKKAKVVIRQGNKELEDMFHQFKCADIVFPHPAKFELNRNGQCLEVNGREKSVVYEPVVENNEIYKYAESKNKGRRKRSNHRDKMAISVDDQPSMDDPVFAHKEPLVFSNMGRNRNNHPQQNPASAQRQEKLSKYQLR